MNALLRQASRPMGAFKAAPSMTKVFSSSEASMAARSAAAVPDHPRRPMDGNQAAAWVAYAMSESSFIYPISPATSMGEHMDAWAASGKKNVFGMPVDVNMMQSEGGAAGALHGAIAAGGMTSTFTASQGLLLMIPNMYIMAGELSPSVIHVSARTVAKHALSIYNDHSDVMACRQTGFAMLCSEGVQEVMDLGLVSHLATLKTRLPFMHFFDGYRTSAEIQNIKVIPYDTVADMVNHEAIQKNVRDIALNPMNPIQKCTGQRPDIFFQANVAANKYYLEAPALIQETMDELAAVTGRFYKLFDYVGSPTADKVVVIMGSGGQTAEEAITYLNKNEGYNVGVLKVRLYRPWSAEHFMEALPKTCKKLAVLDRTREEGAAGSPLFLDVNVTLSDAGIYMPITGGQYGISSKEFTPNQIKAVLDNLDKPEPMKRYVVGINDDVTHTSLDVGPKLHTVPEGTTQCIFWGMGGDGTIGANKEAIKTISQHTTLKGAQGFFANDSKKTLGVTMSHLRFGPEAIQSQYFINSDADYIACHNPSYLMKFQDILDPIKKGGTFVVNSPWATMEEIEANFPPRVKRHIFENDVNVYNIDATALARSLGLGQRINTVMQTVFYGLSGVLEYDEAIKLLKNTIESVYGKKGPEVVAKNIAAVDASLERMRRIEVPAAWGEIESVEVPRLHTLRHTHEQVPEFVTKIMDPVLQLRGDDLPVSAFTAGGIMPQGTTQYEERGVAPAVPMWKPDACTQCNYCAIVCPHAVIRPFLLNRDEKKAAPEGYETRKAKGELAGWDYTIQLATMDCTGCEVCVQSCPDDALYMAPYEQVISDCYDQGHWEYSMTLPNRGDLAPIDPYSVKGSQFQQPLMEFSCACAGCGETPYVKLLTQMFGQQMMIANASGCSSVWGGTATTNPYTTDKETGRGPAWGRSLFEDNAEYGLGMLVATKSQRAQLHNQVQQAMAAGTGSEQLQTAMADWVEVWNKTDNVVVEPSAARLEQLLAAEAAESPLLNQISKKTNLLRKPSQWIIGGDGWAYDIGYGGLDHILSKGEDANILVLDTEMYSNTGGQVSKSTPFSGVVKYASQGKRQKKKDLGMMAMMYEDVYVACIALGADYNQSVRALKEAQEYPGTSLILAYAPCIDWGIDMKYMMDAMKMAVNTGYWPLYRYDPRRAPLGLKPFQLDAGRIKDDLSNYLQTENRFARLLRTDRETGERLQGMLNESNHERMAKYKGMSMDDLEMLDALKKKLGEESSGEKALILYASETGNAAATAQMLVQEFKRRSLRAKAIPMDEIDINELPEQSQVYLIAATCGQGEVPANAQAFWKDIHSPDLPADFLANVRFTTFAMGDSSYVYFNKVGEDLDKRFQELGAQLIVPLAMGDDLAEEGWESAWQEWEPEIWNEIGAPPPPQELMPPNVNLNLLGAGEKAQSFDMLMPNLIEGCRSVPMEVSRLCTPCGEERVAAGGAMLDFDKGERDTRHYEFNLEGISGMEYDVGDCLGIYPHNMPEDVQAFLATMEPHWNVQPDTPVEVTFQAPGTGFAPLPPVMTAGQVFGQMLDVFGKPGRRFYEMLMMNATDPAEKEKLQYLISKEGKPEYRDLLAETTTVADLLAEYPSAVPSLEYMMDFCPVIKPRLYSIASSPDKVGERVELCIVADDWNTPSGKYQHGVCTKYLKNIDVSDGPKHIAARMNPAAVHMPESPAAPMVMVGLGTGLAPIRAMLQKREMSELEGEKIGEMALFFGARHKRTDFLYQDELENKYHNNGKGILTHLHNAFSRDQEHKIYVQDRVAQNPELIYELLVKQKGYFYLCGPAGAAPTAVRRAIQGAFVEVGGHTMEEADQMLTDMQINGHYNLEVW